MTDSGINGKIPITVLYLEDDPAIREAVTVFLELNCARVVSLPDARQGLESFKGCNPDLVITDIMMPGMDGMEFAAQVRRSYPQLPILVTTAFSETAYLMRAIQVGVRGFLRKPLDYGQLIEEVRSAALPVVQQREIERLRYQRVQTFFPGNSPPLVRLSRQIAQVAEGEYSVLIHGEKGTGKTRAARAIHALSRRAKLPFLAVNCHNPVPERLEVDLFGKERGVIGAFAAARGGTLLLRDLASAPQQTQAKLLRYLEERQYYQVGGREPIPCTARVLATVTGEPLQAVAEGRLTEGLFYQLSDLSLRVPALREIREEIPALALDFLAEGAEDAGRELPELTEDALRLLGRRDWPGNLRELKNLMRRSVLHAEGSVSAATLQPLLSSQMAPTGSELPPSLTLEELERWAIARALLSTNGRKIKAAGLLGIDYKRFQRKLTRYGLAKA